MFSGLNGKKGEGELGLRADLKVLPGAQLSA